MPIYRGEIWGAVWPADPLKKKRPLLVVSNNHRNISSNLEDIIVVKITSLLDDQGNIKPTSPEEDLIITSSKGKRSIIRCSNIYTIEKSQLINKYYQLPVAEMNQVNQLLKNVLDLN